MMPRHTPLTLNYPCNARFAPTFGTGHRALNSSSAANFSRVFNESCGRTAAFGGYIQGYLTNKYSFKPHPAAAADIGCKGGWLIPRLATAFDRVYGLDTSADELKQAIQANRYFPNASFHQAPPKRSFGACDFVTAVHAHHHLDTKQKLKDDLFQVAADLLMMGGELLLMGCPSHFIWDTPSHYRNSVARTLIPAPVKEALSDLDLISHDGFVPLEYMTWHRFALEDGTQMRVEFFLDGALGKSWKLAQTHTFWSDNALKDAAGEVGLELIASSNLELGGHDHAYMAMHFRKKNQAAPAVHG